MVRQKIGLLQFLPYFPPHKGGVEGFSEWIAREYGANGYGKVLNVTLSVGQPIPFGKYERDGISVIVLPAFDLVRNFPVPKIWERGFWKTARSIPFENYDVIQTHTRFFLSSFMGGIFAKAYGKKWVHFEHGSGYVVSDRWLVSYCSRLFDKTVGKWILRSADQVIAISQACKKFVNAEFTPREVPVIYSGLAIPQVPKKVPLDNRVRIAYVGRLTYLKGVQCLIEALGKLRSEGVENFACRIVGDGEMRKELEQLTISQDLCDHIEFLGFRDRNEVLGQILPDTDIFVNPSFQEGLPTTVIEALLSRCTVVATDVGGTSEITSGKDLHLVPPGDIETLKISVREALLNFEKTQGLSHSEVAGRFDPTRNMELIHQMLIHVLDKKLQV